VVGTKSCDVLIVGGGPAGLAAAIALRARGADVLVADAVKPPIDKACGEGLMPDSLRDLTALGIDLMPADGAVFSGIRFVNYTDRDTSKVAAVFSVGQGLGISRRILHMRLAQRAAEAGVRVHWNTHVSLTKQVRLNDEACSYRYLVGADGQSSRVRSWTGLDVAASVSRRFGFRRHFRVASWFRLQSPLVETYWGALGQATITPVSSDEICVAAVTRHSHVRMQQVIDVMPDLKDRLMEAEPTDRERGAMTTTRRLKRVVRGNVALVGDASGSVDAITGEGLAVSFRQALLLSHSIESDDLAGYAENHPGTLRLPQRMSRLLLLMDKYPVLRDRMMRMLAGSPEIFRQMLDVHLGETEIQQFLLNSGPKIGLRLAFPAPERI
jgi:menaquinone-9 beta-reductase